MKTSTVLTLLLVVALVTGAATFYFLGIGKIARDTTGPKSPDPSDIEFGVAADQSKLVITQALCTDSRPQAKGCLKVTKGKSGVITFKFNAAPPWKLNKFTICRGSEKTKQKCDLSVWERMEFAVANAVLKNPGKYEPGSKLAHTQADGSIDLSGLIAGPESTEFILLDVNSIKKEYFYNIEACNGVKCISIDPPLVNRGRN